eukprot:403362927
MQSTQKKVNRMVSKGTNDKVKDEQSQINDEKSKIREYEKYQRDLQRQKEREIRQELKQQREYQKIMEKQRIQQEREDQKLNREKAKQEKQNQQTQGQQGNNKTPNPQTTDTPSKPILKPDQNPFFKICLTHKSEYLMYCESCSELLCKTCIARHQSLDHKKFFLKDYLKTYPKTLSEKSKEIKETFDQYKKFKLFEIKNFIKTFQRTINQYAQLVTKDIIKSQQYKELIAGYHVLKYTPEKLDRMRIQIVASKDKFLPIQYREEIDNRCREYEKAEKKLREWEEKRIDQSIQLNKSVQNIKDSLKTAIEDILEQTKIPTVFRDKDTFKGNKRLNLENLPETKLMKVTNEFNLEPSQSFPQVDIIKSSDQSFMTCDSMGFINEWDLESQTIIDQKNFSLFDPEDQMGAGFEVNCIIKAMEDKVIIGGLTKGHVVVQNVQMGLNIIGKSSQSDVLSLLNLHGFKKDKLVLIQDKTNELKILNLEKYVFQNSAIRLIELHKHRKLPNLNTQEGNMHYSYSRTYLYARDEWQQDCCWSWEEFIISCGDDKTLKVWQIPIDLKQNLFKKEGDYNNNAGYYTSRISRGGISRNDSDWGDNDYVNTGDGKAIPRLNLNTNMPTSRTQADTSRNMNTHRNLLDNYDDESQIEDKRDDDDEDSQYVDDYYSEDQTDSRYQSESDYQSYGDDDDNYSQRSDKSRKQQSNRRRERTKKRVEFNDDNSLEYEGGDEDYDDIYDYQEEQKIDSTNAKRKGKNNRNQSKKLNKIILYKDDIESTPEKEHPNLCLDIKTMHQDVISGVLAIGTDIISVSRDCEIKLFQLQNV